MLKLITPCFSHHVEARSFSNQIKDYYKRPGGVARVYGKGHLGVSFLRGPMCAEGMGWERRWVRWVPRGTGTTSGHLGV